MPMPIHLKPRYANSRFGYCHSCGSPFNLNHMRDPANVEYGVCMCTGCLQDPKRTTAINIYMEHFGFDDNNINRLWGTLQITGDQDQVPLAPGYNARLSKDGTTIWVKPATLTWEPLSAILVRTNKATASLVWGNNKHADEQKKAKWNNALLAILNTVKREKGQQNNHKKKKPRVKHTSCGKSANNSTARSKAHTRLWL